MTKIILKKSIIIVSLILLLSVSLPLLFATNIAYALDNEVSFDDTNVLDDLKSSTVNGKPFDLLDFAFDESKDIRIVNFVEYCYSYRKNQQGNYGLYVYLYNPKALDIVENSGQNKIQMAVAWEKDNEGNWNATRYEKFRLRFCNKSEQANYKGLFYKFKVVDREIDGKTMLERVNSNERRYDVSGIELLTNGNQNAIEYGIGGTYKFNGYAKGYGDSDEDTLSCIVEDLETLSLEVHHTNFRTDVSSKGAGHYNDVNTVYFSVPDRFFKEYGNLQKIRAEWWEYKTKMAVITSNEEFRDKIIAYNGYELKNSADAWRWDTNVPYGIKTESIKIGFSFISNWSFNCYPQSGTPSYTSSIYDKIVPYAFYSPKVGVDEVFDFLYSQTVAGNVSSNKLKDYIYNYSNDLGHGYIDCNGRQLSKDLFENFVDNGRVMGYNDKTINFEDTFDLNSFDSEFGWFEKLLAFGLSIPETDGDYKDVLPIYELKESDFVGTDDVVSERLLVNRSDLFALKNYYATEKLKGNRVILFRFANTDYYSSNAIRYMYDEGTWNNPKIYKDDTYVAQQTVFLDFDIIELTFNKDGVYRVIPVVSSPTDIINGFTAPPEKKNILAIIITVLLIILLLVVLQATGILPLILKAIGWLICLPFRLIGKVVNAVKHNKTNKKRE